MPTTILDSHHCAWHAVIDGQDILVRGALASWFGGPNDPEDDGQTASGVSTRANPGIMGCALPVPLTPKTMGSPLPKLPWQTQVTVSTPGGLTLTVPLIDVGPALYTNHAIDLTTAAFIALGGHLNDGLISVDYRIPGAASLVMGNT